MMKIILIVVFCLFFIFAYTKYLEKRGIFFPSWTIEATPAAAGLEFENVFFPTQDGQKLNGWFVPGSANSKVILFLHGNAGNISHRLEQLVLFNKLRLSVFIIDYRGYGKSTGRPSEKGIYRDAYTAYQYLISQKKLKPEEIILYGESLGSQAAIDLANKEKVAAIIAEGTFSSASDMAHSRYPFLPTIFLSIRFDALNKIKKINCPLLIIHSRDDEVVPFRLGKKLFDAALEPKEFIALSGGHNEAVYLSQEPFINALKKFINAL